MAIKRYSLTIRIDDKLHQAWKIKCVAKGITMEAALLDALTRWTGIERQPKRSGDGKETQA